MNALESIQTQIKIVATDSEQQVLSPALSNLSEQQVLVVSEKITSLIENKAKLTASILAMYLDVKLDTEEVAA